MPVSSPDQIVLCDGKGVCCWPAHPRRTGATLCTQSDHRSLLLRGDAGVGKSTLIQRVGCPAFSGLLNLRSLCGELRIQVFGADFAWCPVAECGVNSSLIVEQFDVAGNVLLRFLP